MAAVLCVISSSRLSQAVEWLTELLDALLKTHIRLGDDTQETKVLLEKHRKFVDVAQVTSQIPLKKYPIKLY